MKSERVTTTILRKIINTVIGLLGIALQLFFYYAIFFSGWDLQIVYIVFQILGFLIVIALFNKNMCSSYKMIWSIIILVFPLGGTIIYILFGNQAGFPKWKSNKIHKYLKDEIPANNCLEKLKNEDVLGYKLAKIIHSSTSFPIYNNSDVHFYNDVKDKHQMMLLKMKEAKKYIFMEYFIMADGVLMDSIIEVLKAKGSEGVTIKICYDDVGSKMAISKSLIKRLKSISNLELAKYEPLGFNFNPGVNYRDHRKQTIIDGKVAFVGGDNLADEYIHEKKRFGYWLDNAVMIEGEAVNNCVLGFAESWYMSTKEKIDTISFMSKDTREETNSYVMPFYDGPMNKENPIYNVFTAMTTNSQRYLYISTPYFIIDSEFINSIVLACQSGVDVKVLIPKIPDKKMVYAMSKSHIGDVLKYGGKVYTYTPGFNHSKNIITDDKYAFIGSANIDYRSLYLHLENGVLLINDKEIAEMKKDFLKSISESKEIKYETWKNRSILLKLFEFLCRIFSPLL